MEFWLEATRVFYTRISFDFQESKLIRRIEFFQFLHFAFKHSFEEDLDG